MNSQENSTGLAGDATVACRIPVSAIDGAVDVVEARNGLISKALAAKHLSAMLLQWLEVKFGPDAGKPGPHKDSRTVIVHESQWLELQWLAAEVWDSCNQADKLVLDLDEHLTTICNATYDARKAVAA